MVDAGRQGVGELERLVYWLATNAADRLRCKYLFLIRLEHRTVLAVLIGSLGGTLFVTWHGSCHLRVGMQKRPDISRSAFKESFFNACSQDFGGFGIRTKPHRRNLLKEANKRGSAGLAPAHRISVRLTCDFPYGARAPLPFAL